MQRYYFKSLRARLTILLVLPVVLILLAAGVGGFIFARDHMIRQWHRSVTLQLERAAHEIDMRLSKPVELMTLFSNSGTDEPNVNLLEAIVKRLEVLPGVLRVNLNWHAPSPAKPPVHRGMRNMAMGRGQAMHFKRGTFARISPPVVDDVSNVETVSINMILLDASDTAVGNLEIVIKFSFLVSSITGSAWWQNAEACIADRATGRMVLASGRLKGQKELGETGDTLERSIKTEISEKTTGALRGPGHPPARVAGFHSLEVFPWALVVFGDGKTFLAPIIHVRNGFAIGALLLVALVIGIIQVNFGRMSATIRHLSERAIAVAAGDYGETINVRTRDEIGQLAQSFNTMTAELREKEMIRQTFGRYVDPDFARMLMKKPEAGQLGGRRQEVAVLMTDIRGFTPMAEHLSPEDTVEVLNAYFSAMIPLIQQHRGIIVDFIGDGILAFFEPVDESLSDATDRCLRCAFRMHAGNARLNRKMAERHLPALSMGIGINCGPVVVGNIGSETRKKYGIVGAVVNITQRIQATADAGEVVLPGSVLPMVEDRVSVVRDFTTPLKGLASTMRLYAVGPKST